jgi:hypothetical protein
MEAWGSADWGKMKQVLPPGKSLERGALPSTEKSPIYVYATAPFHIFPAFPLTRGKDTFLLTEDTLLLKREEVRE